jgi:leucyl aminopeptidase
MAPEDFFVAADSKSRPLFVVLESEAATFRESLTSEARAWLEGTNQGSLAGALWTWPGNSGGLGGVAWIVKTPESPFSFGDLADRLPPGTYELKTPLSLPASRALAIGFGLGAYRFTRYKKSKKQPRKLVWPARVDSSEVLALLKSTFLARDLINTPASDMGPSALAEAAHRLAKQHDAKFSCLVGQELEHENYRMILAVGRAASDPPRLVDMSWGKKSHPKLTLVGKGVCFDTGGLNLKPGQYMKLMKKDMGGAALVLALAEFIMSRKLPVRLRVLIPMVENSVAGNAMRPLDVLTSKKGVTVEVGDTDAEGRLVLADPLTEAAGEEPDLIIDAATLTGAARVALGTMMPGVFSLRDETWAALERASRVTFDPLWRLPLFEPYRKKLDSKVADYSNVGDSYGGAITAALFLEEFVRPARDWLHIDTMAYNLEQSPGRPVGGEAQGLLALTDFLTERYSGAGSRSSEAGEVGAPNVVVEPEATKRPKTKSKAKGKKTKPKR